MTSKMDIKRQGGFSLIEVLVVLVILAALVAIATPTLLSTTFPHMKLKSSAREVFSMFEYARGKAVSSTRQYGVQFDLDANPKRFQVMTKVTDTAPWTRDTDIAVKDIETGIDIFNVTIGGVAYTTGTSGVIAFDPFGSASLAAVRLLVTQIPTDRYIVSIISSSGRVSIGTW